MAWVIKTLKRKKKSAPVEPEPIYKLDTKCFHALFDWMSLGDLHSFGQTCKQFQQIAGEYFQKTYLKCEIRVGADGIYAKDNFEKAKPVIGTLEGPKTMGGTLEGPKTMGSTPEKSKQRSDSTKIQLNGFIKFVEKIAIHAIRNENADEIFNFIEMSSFESLRQIHFVAINLTEARVKCLKKVMKDIEVLKIDSCVWKGKLYHNFLKMCKKSLKHLSVHDGSDANWLLKHYPKLEHLELYKVGFTIDKLEKFFELNPDIRSFAIDINYLWANERTLRTANIRLDDLAVNIHGWESKMDAINSVFDKFQKRGLYKRLHVYTSYYDAESFKRITSMPLLDKLYLSNKVAAPIDIPQKNHLTEISFRYFTDILDMEHLNSKLDHLERIHFKEASLYDVLPFVQKLVKLKIIAIEKTKFNLSFIMNLDSINRQRELLHDAQKVTLYIDETVYLETKKFISVVNFSKLELKRAQLYEWNHHFNYADQSQRSFS